MKEFTYELHQIFKEKKKPLFIFLIVVFSLCLVGMVIATFFDLRISRALNDSGQWFGSMFSKFGELPAYVTNAGFFVALFVMLAKDKKYRWLCILPLAVAMTLGYFFLTRYYTGLDNVLFNGMVFTVFSVFLFIIPNRLFKGIFFILLIGCVLSAVTNLVMVVFKTLWGRVRFRDLKEGFTNFTPWYKPNGVTGNQSFFSGHVTSACITTVLWLVPIVFKLKNRFVNVSLFILPILYTAAMMYARIVVGAHYLSDVTFAVVNFTVCTILTMKILCRQERIDESLTKQPLS